MLSVYLNVLQKQFVGQTVKFDIMVIRWVISAHRELGIGLFKKMKIGQTSYKLKDETRPSTKKVFYC